MPTTSPIALKEPNDSAPPRISQLYAYVELLTEGDPPRNSLFVLEPARGPLLGAASDRLLIVDPPADLTDRFRLPEETAVLLTGQEAAPDLPLLQTVAGGVAHVRLGEQFLDVYSHTGSAVVHLPPLGVLCTGVFGSDLVPPALGQDSNGSAELDTLRLLARLVKQHHVRLQIPRIGTTAADLPSIMARLAADVQYLHNLQRVIPPLAAEQGNTAQAMAIAETLLPPPWRNSTGWPIHRANLGRLVNR